MAVSTTIDTSKSLAELTGVDWGLAPADAGTLVRERHEIRRTPIRKLTAHRDCSLPRHGQ
jgi:hypothetical protein